MSDETAAPAAPGVMYLWYCAKCTRMILPPGTEGVVTPEGNLCPKCAPAPPQPAKQAVSARVATGIAKAARADGISTGESARRIVLRAERSEAPGEFGSRQAPSPPAQRSQRIPAHLLVAGAVFSLGLVIFLVVLLTRNREPEETGTPQDKTAVQQPVAAAPAPSAPVTPANEPDVTHRGPRFLEGIDARHPAPGTSPGPAPIAAPSAPVVQPVQPQPQPQPQPQVQPAAVPKPAESPAAVEAAQLQEFNTGLKKAAENGNAGKYAGALALLKNLKDKYSGAKWWDAHSGELAKTEREVQRQLDEYNNEVAGALQEVAKAGDLKSLDKIEAAWKAKAGTAEAGTDGKWTLLELVSMRAESGAAMALQNDGSILVSGNNPAKDRYIVVARTLWSGIRAFRLEAIPDASLPNKGPGRSPGNGNFALSAFKAEYAPLDNLAKTQQVSFSKATETYGQRENLASQAINNREDTWWDVFPEVGKLQVAVFETATPIGSEKGVSITFTLAFQHHNQHGLGRFRLLLTTAPTPPDAKTPTGEVNPPGAPGDELGAKPAQQILAAVGKARAHITEQHRDKNAVQIKEQLDILEKQIKFKSQPQAQLTKTFETLEAELAKDPVLAEKMVERVAGLRFDLRLSKDGELTLYKGQVKQVGSVAEVTYDFSTIEQFQAWIWDNPGNAGSVEHDPKSKLVRIKVTGQHDWTGKDRKNTPIFRLPFYFMADNWAVEATVSLVSDGGKQNKPDYGILVWDGGTDAVGLSVKDQGKEMLAQVAFSAPGKAKATALAAKTKERMVLRMDCQQGTVNCTVTGPKGLPARFKEKLGFEPHYAGLFVRTMDGGENATVAFENVKILGFPNKEKLKELADSARAEIVEVAKKHAKGEPVNIAHLGHAASRSTWKPDAAHEPAAAIDNNPNTYWDEEHDKPEYRFAVTFDQPHTVNAISISGYEQHNGAPKDFDILADGKVVLPVRNANYTGNQLRVEFPATQLKDLELKITACHGHSPTIRELGIYEP